MPQLDFDGANSKVSADKIQGQSGTTVTVPTGHKIAGTDANSITVNGVNAVAVAHGTSGNVLTSTGSAWASSTPAAGGAWSVKSSGTMSSAQILGFTGLSKTTKFILKNIVTGTDGKSMFVRTSTDGGTTYDADSGNYRHTVERDQYTTPNTVRTNSTTEFLMYYTLGNAAGEVANLELTMYNPEAGRPTQFYSHSVLIGDSGYVHWYHGVAERTSTENVDAVRFQQGYGAEGDTSQWTCDYIVLELN